MVQNHLIDCLEGMRNFYNTHATHSYSSRKLQLEKLKSAILHHQHVLHEALHLDLKKSAEESWVTEIGFVINEINYAIKHLRAWMMPENVPTNLLNIPSSSHIMNEPKGVVLIIAPWNYPCQLLFTPLVGAIAAGNCAVLKASEFAPHTASILKTIIEENFERKYILFTEGDGAETVPFMTERFQFAHIFYTGSTAVGRLIYKMAADKLVPVTLELGGKSPCVIEKDANIKVAARRVALAKFSNAGQMCVAPDYVLVHESVKDSFINHVKQAISRFFTTEPSSSYDYCKIINERQFDRLSSYLKEAKILFGGKTNRASLYIEPTLVEGNESRSQIMEEEIFGPLMPIFQFGSFDEAKRVIEMNPDPLAFYVFTSSVTKEKQWLETISCGGACINNCSWHLTNHYLPFGGRGSSGLGAYHGKNSFDVFSHRKAIMKTPTWFDPSIKYPPFKGRLGLFKRIIG